jgi:hypothetical protein
VAPATYTVKFRSIGYLPRTISVSTNDSRGTSIAVFLDRDTARITNVCLPYMASGIRIRAVDARTHANILAGSVIFVRDGKFSDSTIVPAGYEDPIWRVESVGERQGNYAVTVSRLGYKPWMKQNAVVSKAPGSCHVTPFLIDATLEPIDN